MIFGFPSMKRVVSLVCLFDFSLFINKIQGRTIPFLLLLLQRTLTVSIAYIQAIKYMVYGYHESWLAWKHKATKTFLYNRTTTEVIVEHLFSYDSSRYDYWTYPRVIITIGIVEKGLGR
jgi:hypothetical protein